LSPPISGRSPSPPISSCSSQFSGSSPKVSCSVYPSSTKSYEDEGNIWEERYPQYPGLPSFQSRMNDCWIPGPALSTQIPRSALNVNEKEKNKEYVFPRFNLDAYHCAISFR
jgi:hypothetical protein